MPCFPNPTTNVYIYIPHAHSCDAVLWCDVGLRFVTPVHPLEGEGGKRLSHRRVALRYLRTDLLVDVLCRWPWDACVSGAGPFPLATRHTSSYHDIPSYVCATDPSCH